MNRYLLGIGVCVFLFSMRSMGAQEARPTLFEVKNFLSELKDNQFNGVILAAQKDSIFHHQAYGFANLEHKVENTLSTKFNTASITKMFTAVAILQLIENGQLNLEDTVGKYLGNYPNKTVKENVTIHQLLTHTSGLNNYLPLKAQSLFKITNRRLENHLPLFEEEELLFEPGSDYGYSASGYILLGLIVESVTNYSYFEYVKQHIFEPSEMKNTFETPIDSIVENKAYGYTSFESKGKVLSKNDYKLSMGSPAGFFYTTSEDLFNFSKSLRGHRLLSKEMTALMTEPHVQGYYTNYGYGVSVDLRFNQKIIGHSGGWYGIRGEVIDFLSDNYTIVLLSNFDDTENTGVTMVSNILKNIIADKPINK